MRITKDMVFSVDRGTDEELAQTLAVFERDGLKPYDESIRQRRFHNFDLCVFTESSGMFVYGTTNERKTTHYTPSEFLTRFQFEHTVYFPGEATADAPAVIADAPAVESLSVLREAMDIVGGARKAEYGDQRVNFQKYADIATLMLDSADLDALAGGRIPSAVVVKVLMAVKLGRHAFKPKRDNLVDLCGYADILHTVQGG